MTLTHWYLLLFFRFNLYTGNATLNRPGDDYQMLNQGFTNAVMFHNLSWQETVSSLAMQYSPVIPPKSPEPVQPSSSSASLFAVVTDL